VDPVDVFNGLPAERAEADLLACCAVDRWAAEVTAGRPYRQRGDLLAAAEAALRGLTWAEVAQALAVHPRIGERVEGSGRGAAWSRREQSGAAGADEATKAALAQANREYEQRFGHVFLIFASGRSDVEMLAAARERLGNDDATEQAVVAGELRRIAMLRLERLIDGLG
jgi:2-oxo-4-hydroxy-4-carboxy-5-ureidoimidazoline decarboxylase